MEDVRRSMGQKEICKILPLYSLNAGSVIMNFIDQWVSKVLAPRPTF